MKNLLKRSYLRNFALGLMLVCVTASTVWATTTKALNINEKETSIINPRICVHFYEWEPGVSPWDYVWDCIGCTKVYDVTSWDTMTYGCDDGTWD